jgi:hypothetical protein
MLARSLPFAFLTALAFPASSSARSLVDFVGVTIGHLGDVDGRSAPQLGRQPDGVGYKYSYYGVLFVDFWRDDGQFCIYKEDQYHVISKAEAASLLGIPENELDAPFFYRYPPGLLGLGFLLTFALFVYAAMRINRREAPDPAAQPYRDALEVFRETVRRNQQARADAIAKKEIPAETDPWETAIAHLVALGVDKAEAEDNLSKILAEAIAVPPKAA